MATIGFLLAPLREIPASRDEKWMATVQSWIDIANRAWFDLWKMLPPEQQKDRGCRGVLACRPTRWIPE